MYRLGCSGDTLVTHLLEVVLRSQAALGYNGVHAAVNCIHNNSYR